MIPGHPTRTNAVFYRPGDLLSELQVPLLRYLSAEHLAQLADGYGLLTDAQGIANNSVYLNWFEVARIAYLARFHVAAATDPVLGGAFLRVVNLMNRPESLLGPTREKGEPLADLFEDGTGDLRRQRCAHGGSRRRGVCRPRAFVRR